MNIAQLFKALPRDLQWEVLCNFVGSHSVRKGKLIRKLVFDERHQMLQNIPRIQMSTTWYPPDVADMFPNSVVNFSNGTQLMFTTHPELGVGLKGYLFISNTIRDDIPESSIGYYKTGGIVTATSRLKNIHIHLTNTRIRRKHSPLEIDFCKLMLNIY